MKVVSHPFGRESGKLDSIIKGRSLGLPVIIELEQFGLGLIRSYPFLLDEPIPKE